MLTRTPRGGSSRRWAVVLAMLPLVALAGCEKPPARPPAPTPAPSPAPRLSWQEVTLPAGSGDRIAVRAATSCAGRWYVVGALVVPDGGTRPAAWTSADGRAWRSIPTAATSFYGKQNILYTVACRAGVVVAIGAKSGGVHGNPRTSSWVMGDTPGPTPAEDVPLREVTAAFQLYGGPNAVSVSRLAAGPGGWLIAGNRTSGAAVWTSTDGATFEVHEGVPMLASDPQLETAAADAVADGTGWTVVGGGAAAGRPDRDPVAWTSADGATWRRTVIAGTTDYEELQRVVALDGGPLAVGLRGGAFGAWSGQSGRWRPAGRFGTTRPTGSDNGSGAVRVAGVSSIAAVAGAVLVTMSDGTNYRLWSSVDRGGTWTRIPPPAEHPAGADRAGVVCADGGRWLYLADDGATGRVWLADPSR